jgi:hypothetical protein
MGGCEARTRGALVSNEIRARPRTPHRAATRDSGGSALILERALRRGADSNRCTGLCRPLPNLSATAPGENIVSGAEFAARTRARLERSGATCAEWTLAARCEPCPGVDGASFGRSPGPLPGLHYGEPATKSAAAAEPDMRGVALPARSAARSREQRRWTPPAHPSGPAARGLRAAAGRSPDGERAARPTRRTKRS